MKVLQSLCCLFAAVMVISASSPPSETPAWSARILQISRNHQCSHESAVEDLLKFPLASTGEAFGLARRFQPFRQPGLERARLHAVTQPRATLSVGLYLLRWCQQGALCGILHHLGKGNVYGLLVQLTHSGDVIIQARLTAGGDRAFRAGVVLPVRKWIRLDCSMQGSKVLLEATWDNETRRREYEFQDSIHHDDTDGYFVFGGSRFLSGIHGFFGPIRFYRLGTKEVKTHLEPLSEQLGQTLQECEDMKALTRAFLQGVRESQVNTAGGQ